MMPKARSAKSCDGPVQMGLLAALLACGEPCRLDHQQLQREYQGMYCVVNMHMAENTMNKHAGFEIESRQWKQQRSKFHRAWFQG